ncbi:Cleavage/polyadenylation specificity factor, A subunit, C-terminal [Penicillium expansum]|uniref:Cleavage/polyadenylation specificity factor, A subunit, C-terminal n=1 Tax=Penicillium expansum TaxID=27334 RepID=A0A0A2J8D9_PENEN|nr:Cleavage/polyadenylation specificity factor, A subunit, C-terminal [Penicillium expansum]KGO51599.1 Cleavage/polyadenylation specificity factor, A subunit, C-terminal [Penicillium expansum]
MSDNQPDMLPTRLHGLLTQPLIPSPVINWILPARLRDKDHNDVVFIGERRIQIKEALPSGHLQDVVEKSDLEGSIIGAKVINVSTQGASGLMAHYYDNDNNHLPPQILFLATDSNELLFMYYSEVGDGPFVCYNRPLPRDVNIADKYGKHIAVDPKSRAVAVSASRNFFGILWLKSAAELQAQMAQGKLNPLESESFLQVDGDILFMEFLYPKDDNDKRTILLLIVYKLGSTRSMVFEWNEDSMPSRMSPKFTSNFLPQQDQLPSMVIPLAKESSYLLITTNSMAMYTPNSSFRPMRYPPIIPDTESSEAGLWTRFARPSRNRMYSQRYDGILLCQEKGWIYYLEFGNDGELETQTSLGQLHCDVDTAFDILDMGYEGGDFIIAAGSHGGGGLFVQEARDRPICVQRFLNWAPVSDAVIIPSNPPAVLKHNSYDYDRLFVSSTSASGTGAITELRYGIEAQIGVSAALGELSSIRDMWAVSFGAKDSIYLLASDPLSSMLLRTTPDMRDGITALEDDTGLDIQQTLAMDCTPSGVIVRVTERAVHFFVPTDFTLNSCVEHDPHVFVTAAIVDGPSSTVIMTTRSNKGNFLHILRVVTTEGCASSLSDHEPPYPLQKEPICISYQNWGELGFIFLGTSDGTVLSFEVYNETGGIRQHADTLIEIVDSPEDVSEPIESLAVINTLSDDGIHAFLFCGLRSGTLVPFEIDTTIVNVHGDPVFGFKCLKQRAPHHLGQTSIIVKSYNNFALFTCGDDFWRVSYAPDGNGSDYFLSRVWITDQNCPAYFPTRFSSFDIVDVKDRWSEVPITYLFCFADGQLLVCSLEQEAKVVPRRIDIPGNPSKLTYSNHLRSLIVSYSVAEVGNQARPFDLSRTAYVEFVDPNTQSPVVSNDMDMVSQGLLPWRPHGVSGEKITCIFDWMPEREGNAYHLIAIGTSINLPHQPNNYQGRLMLIQASRDSNYPGQITCIDKHTQRFKDPVYAMAACEDSLIVVSGKKFFTVSSRNSQTKWVRNITATLPSTAVAMEVRGKMIYVTSSRHSLLVYKIVDGDIQMHGFDPISRDGLSHTLMPGYGIQSDLIFVSTRGGATRAFTDLDQPGDLVPRPTANLPVSLIKLARGIKSPDSLTTTKTFYGFGINGSVYRLLALDAEELRLLQLLLNICLRDEVICPSLSRRYRYLDAINQVENNMHIDGNILARLASRNSKYLDEILMACNRSQFKDLTPETVHMFFGAVEDVLGVHVNHTQALFSWLRKMLHIEI